MKIEEEVENKLNRRLQQNDIEHNYPSQLCHKLNSHEYSLALITHNNESHQQSIILALLFFGLIIITFLFLCLSNLTFMTLLTSPKQVGTYIILRIQLHFFSEKGIKIGI